MGHEGEMRLQPEEFPGQLALVRPGELGHGDLAVVIADAGRNAAEEGEGLGVAFVEGLGAFPGEEAAEAGVAVRQRQHEQGRLVPYPGDDYLGAAEVHLALAGRVEQRHEDLGLGLLVGADGIADDAGTPRVTLLVTQALIDPSGRVTLLGRCVPVVVDDLLKDGQERAEDGPGARLRGAEGRRLRVPDDLADGPEVEVVFGASLSHADLAGQDAPADLGPKFHVGEHSCLPLSGSWATLSLAGWRLGALHFLVGTALHFLIGIHTTCRILPDLVLRAFQHGPFEPFSRLEQGPVQHLSDPFQPPL